MKMKKTTFNLPFICSFILIALGLSLIASVFVPFFFSTIHYKHNQRFYNTLIWAQKRPSMFLFSNSLQLPTNENLLTTEPIPTIPPTIMPQYLQLLERNSEVVGWIAIDDTPINYPILQHSDNAYYLSKDIDQLDSIYGSIYMDYRNNGNLTDFNTLIYGHNMRNGSMFHELLQFKEENFFTEHPYIYVSNLYETITYEVFSVYVVDADKETVNTSYPSSKLFLDYLTQCANRSLYKKSIILDESDRIITLVTCSYELENARTLVQARRIS